MYHYCSVDWQQALARFTGKTRRMLSAHPPQEVVREVDDTSAAFTIVGARTTETTHVDFYRPGIIFANAIKPTPDSLVGLHLRARNGAVYISRIEDDSLFCDCNLAVGHRVVAVNNFSCIGVKEVKLVVELLHKTAERPQDPTSLAARTVSICVHNEQGDPRTVSSCIQKPDPSTHAGVSLVNKRGYLQVNRIDPDSLFANSLLLPRQRCVHINGMSCAHWTSQEAAKFILDAPDRVTIVSVPPYQQVDLLAISTAWRQPPQPKLRIREKLWRNVKRLMPGRSTSSSC
jgi:predicted metalloprotease with PDZ domain